MKCFITSRRSWEKIRLLFENKHVLIFKSMRLAYMVIGTSEKDLPWAQNKIIFDSLLKSNWQKAKGSTILVSRDVTSAEKGK